MPATALAITTNNVPADVDASTPKITTAAYLRSVPRWNKCRALMQGTEAIREGGTDYLPQYPNESDELYEIRKVICGLFNGFKRTVQATLGLLGMQSPVLGADMPDRLVQMWENADGSGMHGDVFMIELAKASVVDGFAGVLTEFPRADDPRIDRSRASLAAAKPGAALSIDDEKALGLQPYFVLVKADEVLQQLYETLNGRKVLVLLVLREYVQERKGRFGLHTVARYRVYDRRENGVFYELWTADGDGEPVLREGPTIMNNLAGIPWSPCATGERLSEGEYNPTLIDLADLNLEHHQTKTNMRSLESLACVPTPVRVGATPGTDGEYPPLVLGPGNTIEAPATEGVQTPVYWLAPPVGVLSDSRQSLEALTTEMGAMGASFLVPQPRLQETATAHMLDSTAEKASISSVGRKVQDCLESAFGFAGQYIKQPAGSITLNQEFEQATMDPATMTAWATIVEKAGIPLRLFLAALQKGRLIDEGEDLEELEAEMLVNIEAGRAAKQQELEAQQQRMQENGGSPA